MLTFQIDGLGDLNKNLREFTQQEKDKAMAGALNRAAFEVRDAVRTGLPHVFDRPTPYTVQGVIVSKKATPNSLWAEVSARESGGGGTPQDRYLLPEVVGGSRRAKRFELALTALGVLPMGWRAVPAPGARLDAYGNMSQGQIQQILTQLRAGTSHASGFSARKAIGQQRRAGGRFFAIAPSPMRQHPAPGVYQREFMGSNITAVLLFVRDARYHKRFDFQGMCERAAGQKVPPAAEQAMGDAIKKAGLS